MAENTTVHIGENSPEQVAYRLLQDVLHMEKKTTLPHMASRDSGGTLTDRKYLLDAYAECLIAVRAPQVRKTERSNDE